MLLDYAKVTFEVGVEFPAPGGDKGLSGPGTGTGTGIGFRPAVQPADGHRSGRYRGLRDARLQAARSDRGP